MPEEILASFPDEFREGMAARAEQLGDRGPSAPEHWEAGLGTGEAHVLATVYAIDDEHLERRAEELRGVGARGGRDDAGPRDARRGAAGRARPLRLLRRDRPAGRGGQRRAPRPGDGQPDGAGRLARRRAPASSCTATSTRTARCRRRRRRLSTATGPTRSTASCTWTSRPSGATSPSAGGSTPAGRELLAAKIVGRWRDGTPLARLARRPDARPRRRPRADQRLLLRRRPSGAALPGRRAHPPRQPARRRGLLRRPADQPPPHHPPRPALRPRAARRRARGRRRERGLVFVCFNASIWRQFETIQTLWIDDGDPFGLGADKDFLIGQPDGDGGKMTIPGHPPFFLKPQPRFVTVRGGEYLFRPEHQRAALAGGRRWAVHTGTRSVTASATRAMATTTASAMSMNGAGRSTTPSRG